MKFSFLLRNIVFLLNSFSILVICIEGEKDTEQGDCIHSLTPDNPIHINPSDNACKVYVIKAGKKSSIITVSTILNDNNRTKDFKKYGEESYDIDVIFSEFTTFKNETKSSIITKKWALTAEDFSGDNSYFSRTSELHMSITIQGKLSDNDLRLLCEEVTHEDFTFSVNEGSSSKVAGVIIPYMSGTRYRPNCVTLFQITKPPKININSIDMTLESLDIDEGVGEYLLIGAGKAPFEGPPPLFISSYQRRRYKINDENAYVVFVATSTRTLKDGFKIRWKFNETKISGEEDEVDNMRRDDVLQSVQACIYNISAAQIEFNKSEERFQKFRDNLAEIGMEYAVNNSLKITTITPSHVDIFRVSGMIPDQALVVMIKIQGSKQGKAAFTWLQLQEIIAYYSNNCNEEIDGYKIGRCPARNIQNPWINIAFYGIIPGVCLLCFFIWTWKQAFSNYFSRRIKRAVLQMKQSEDLSAVSMEDNIYSNDPLPDIESKVRLTNDQGRRFTLNFDQIVSSCGEEDSDVEIFNRMDFKSSFKSQRNFQDTPSIRSSIRSSKKPEINLAFEDDDECILTVPPTQKTPEMQSPTVENFYDTVKYVKNDKNEITIETKL